jgi:integrase
MARMGTSHTTRRRLRPGPLPARRLRPERPQPPSNLRAHLCTTLRPDAEVDSTDDCERWLARWSPRLGDLDRATLARACQQVGIGDKGQQLAPNTVKRYRRVAHTCIRRAVDLDQIPSDPWPPSQRGRSHRKANRSHRAIDVRRLPGPSSAIAIINALRSHQPGSRNFQMMAAVVFYAGLRPSEVAMLRPRALYLPDEGWGRIAVDEADDGWGEPVEPKTGKRSVPIPPQLVDLLRVWITDGNLVDDALLFRSRGGRRPAQSNWSRALRRACTNSNQRRVRPYDFRHAAATLWIRSGVPLAEAARRLGHTVETLVSTYIGAMEGDEAEANARVDAANANTPAVLLGGSR